MNNYEHTMKYQETKTIIEEVSRRITQIGEISRNNIELIRQYTIQDRSKIIEECQENLSEISNAEISLKEMYQDIRDTEKEIEELIEKKNITIDIFIEEIKQYLSVFLIVALIVTNLGMTLQIPFLTTMKTIIGFISPIIISMEIQALYITSKKYQEKISIRLSRLYDDLNINNLAIKELNQIKRYHELEYEERIKKLQEFEPNKTKTDIIKIIETEESSIMNDEFTETFQYENSLNNKIKRRIRKK